MSLSTSGSQSRHQTFSIPFVLIVSSLIVGISIFSPVTYTAWFEDTSVSAGIEYRGPSFGASWGDLNGDGWADLWVGNHGQQPDLFQNNKDGTFSKVPLTILSDFVDMHAAAWADFDNDGDQDLFFEVGAQFGLGTGPDQLLINTDNTLENKAAEYGVSDILGRGRTPLWVDWNSDGKLDLLINNDVRPDGLAPTALYSQAAASFLNSTQVTGLSADSNSSFAQLIHMNNRPAPILLINGNPFPNRAYDLGSLPFTELSATPGSFPPSLYNVNDAAIADFNGDLLSDIFVTRLKAVSQVLLQQGSVLARINVQGDEKGFSLTSAADLNIKIDPPSSVALSKIFIGQQGIHPTTLDFTLSPQDSTNSGILPHTPGLEKGVFIGYDPAKSQWTFLVNGSAWFDVNFTISDTSPITDTTAIGFSDSNGDLPDNLLSQSFLGFSDRSVESGFVTNTACTSVVAEDFDNDMDVDLYLACQGPIKNSPNILYENTGNGVFQLLPNAGGAEGTIDGRSDSVVAADYDNDGFIDLFVTNGSGASPFNDGPSQLFHNLGNNNHWIEIDLEGSLSNRNGIASTVLLTAGGKTQMREQNGGMHKYSQNHQRLHFGLGQNTSVDQIDVTWPSGTHQNLRNLDADKLIRIVEQSIDNNKPIIAGIPATTIAQNSDYHFKPAFSDSDGDSLIFSITNKPSWGIFDTTTGELSGTPGNGDVGTTRGIEITVNDQRGQPNSLASLPIFDIEVTNINDSPVVTATIGPHQAAQATALHPLDVSSNFLDPDTDMLTFSISGLPVGTGLGISASGVISGTPSYVDALSSPISITVTAADPSGASVSDTFALSVNITDSNNDGIPDTRAIALGLNPGDPAGDTDIDGIPDSVEIGNIDSPLDQDNDGIIDALEPGATATNPSIASGLALSGGTTANLSTAAGESLSQVTSPVLTGAPAGIKFPFGAISYLTTAPIGGSVTVSIDFSIDLPVNTVLYKLDHAGVYAKLPVNTWTKKTRHTIELTLRDGDLQTDLDGIANGVIDDPIAIGDAGNTLPDAINQAGGGGGGCSLNANRSEDPVLLIMILVSIVRLKCGRSKKQQNSKTRSPNQQLSSPARPVCASR